MTLPALAQKTKLTKGERTFMVNFLTATQERLLEVVNSVDDELWDYQPTPDSWTVAGCFEHILFAETQLTEKIMERMMVEENRIDQDLSVEDGLVISKLTNRTQKVKTPPPFEPNGRWSTKQEMIDKLNRSRAYLVDYVATTKDPLRDYASQSPVGLRLSY